jgi:hypothetical protein
VYDAFIVNDVLEESIRQAIELVNAERTRRRRTHRSKEPTG